jgi:hypothetical protein
VNAKYVPTSDNVIGSQNGQKEAYAIEVAIENSELEIFVELYEKGTLHSSSFPSLSLALSLSLSLSLAFSLSLSLSLVILFVPLSTFLASLHLSDMTN